MPVASILRFDCATGPRQPSRMGKFCATGSAALKSKGPMELRFGSERV